jgi:hypothetical protein
MRKLKKRAVLISSGVAALFIAPLIAFAVLYSSETRKNDFAPNSVDIEVREGTTHSDELKNTLILDNDTKSVDKPVEIKDTRKSADELLRVCFIPVWYDSAGNACYEFDIGTPTLRESAQTLTFGSDTDVITLHLADGWSDNGWSYSDTDGYFCFNGKVNSDRLTPRLLSSVTLGDDAYALTDPSGRNMTLRIDVLADAIQAGGGASTARQW